MKLPASRHYPTTSLSIIPTTICKERSLHICNIINRKNTWAQILEIKGLREKKESILEL
jgi:hypothetical protein